MLVVCFLKNIMNTQYDFTIPNMKCSMLNLTCNKIHVILLWMDNE